MTPRERIVAALETLGPDELELLAVIAERAAAQGRHSYGELHVATDPRRFEQEALLEVADALFYVSAGLLRAGRPRARELDESVAPKRPSDASSARSGATGEAGSGGFFE